MKQSAAYSLLLVIGIFFLMGFACSNSDDKPATTTANSTTSSNSASLGNTATSAATRDITGTYNITGQNEGGGGSYGGTLIVTDRDDVYQFSWNSGGRTYDGVGVQTGDHVAVSFADGANGTGCGVVLYKTGTDGSLDGKAGYWGKNSGETETATRTKGTDLEGEYDLKGQNPEGGSYSGTLNVKKNGAGYDFTWNTGTTLRGFGIKQGNYVSVGLGSNKCGFVGYDVKSDGTLDGKWGSVGTTSVGTETAKKQ